MAGGSKQTSSSGPPKWAVPYFQDYMKQSSQVAGLPYKPYTGSRVADYNPVQNAGFDAITRRAMQGTPEASAGRGELTRTLSGGYLGTKAPSNANLGVRNPYAGPNPFLEKQIDAAQGDVVRNYNLTAAPSYGTANARSGSFGNAGLAEMENESRRQLAGELGRISSGMRFNDYTTQQGLAENFTNRLFQGGESQANRQQQGYESERGRMMGGLGMVPGFANMDYTDASQLLNVGDALQRQQQSYMDDDYSRFTEARDYPLRQLDILGRSLGGGVGETRTEPGRNKAAGALGGGLAGAQIGSMLGLTNPWLAGAGALLGVLG